MAPVSQIEHGVVELRTDVGRLYVCPTGWQRLYLRWTFRNFHSLPLQILNRRQKRLIETLSRSAIVTPGERVPASAIIGIVENMNVLALPSAAEMTEAARAAKAAVADAKLAVVQGKAEEAVLEHNAAEFPQEAAAKHVAAPQSPNNRAAVPQAEEEGQATTPRVEVGQETQGPDIKRGSWAVRLAAVSGAAVLILGFWLAPLRQTPQINIPNAPPAPPVAAETKPVAVPAAVAPPKHDAGPVTSANVSLNAAAAAGVSGQHAAKRAPVAAPTKTTVPDSIQLPVIAEAPRSGFIYPVAPNPNLVGKVVLKAVVGSDGAVKQVEVLSGDRALASAAVRAVKQWRYAPVQVDGRIVEAETQVTISFLGDDAVSIILPQSR